MQGKKVTAFWLVPAAPEKQLFGALIRILARELKAPLFEPHVTLFVSATRAADVRRLLKDMSSRSAFEPVLQKTIRRSQARTRFGHQVTVQKHPL